MKRSYSELIQIPSFAERLNYLKLLDNNVTSPRHMSAQFYQSRTWKTIRQMIIDRDFGFDLGVFGVYIEGPILVHHINPIDESDIMHQTKKLLDPENLISVSGNTHNLIHYNKKEKEKWVERKPGDTKLW
jgi:5-methylcytosine-specific restriction endonuclease McrA